MKEFCERIRRMNGLKLNTKFTMVTVCFVVLPVALLTIVLFHNMKTNIIDENMTHMQYTMEKNHSTIETGISSINMTTQFFLSDELLKEKLKGVLTGEKSSTEELMTFYNTDIASLERLVNNNPLLYGVRVYAPTDNVQEMVPILYTRSRMQKQDWASDEKFAGWYYNYSDRIFEGQTLDDGERIVALITPIVEYGYGTVGTIEAAMSMKTMFPSLYGDADNEWGCFVTSDGKQYFGNKQTAQYEELVRSELARDTEEEINCYYKSYKGSRLIISSLYVKELGGTLFCVRDITKNLHQLYQTLYMFLCIMIVIVVILVFVINYIVKQLLRQFYDILKSIRQVQKGDLNVMIDNCRNDEMGELGRQINKMLERIRQLMDDNLKREMLVKNSEIRALQNQINAHFIYNVLESIKMMAEIDEEYAISDAITSLGKLLRYSMKWVSGNVKVEEELEYIRNYLTLINLRFDYEIYLSVNIPELILKQEIPKMSLQPIVENAIYHGIEQMASDTNIYIKGIVDGDDCILEVTDAGRGMTEEELERVQKKIAGEIETSGGSGNGIGLKNVQDRIVMSFGPGYGISIASMLGCYTKVMVKLPLHRQGVMADNMALLKKND